MLLFKEHHCRYEHLPNKKDASPFLVKLDVLHQFAEVQNWIFQKNVGHKYIYSSFHLNNKAYVVTYELRKILFFKSL